MRRLGPRRKRAVYWIHNKDNGKVYIGSTVRRVGKRWVEHRHHLKTGTHSNSYLQRSYDKHGEDAFEYRVLQFVPEDQDILRAEQDWLDRVRLDGFETYNGSNHVTKTFLGQTHTRETRQRISEAMMGNQRGLGQKKPQHAINAAVESRRIPRPALINVKTGKEIPAGLSAPEIARLTGIPRRTIQNIVDGTTQNSRTGWRLKQ